MSSPATHSRSSSRHEPPDSGQHGPGMMDMKPYRRLAMSLAASYVVMFAVMFARVNAVENVLLSLNQAYMAGLMVSPMLLIMLATMWGMFPNRKLNLALVATGVVLTAVFWTAVRTQAGVGDRQFLRSMIPHHAGAILVCRQASLSDAQVRELCGEIIASQEREIREMKGMLGGG